MSESGVAENDSPEIQTRPLVASKSSRTVCAGIATSLLAHCTVLSACIYLASDSIRLTNFRSGHAAYELQLTLPVDAVVSPIPIEFVAQYDDVHSPAGLLSPQREVTLARSNAVSAFIAQPQSLELESANIELMKLPRRQQAESVDIRPTNAMEIARRPKKQMRRLPAPATPPSIKESGTESWVPEPLATNIPPVYPLDAVSRRAEGSTLLRVTISKEGVVLRIEVKQSSGWPQLDRAAVDAVTKWRFRKQSSAVAVKSQTAVIPFEFKLNR